MYARRLAPLFLLALSCGCPGGGDKTKPNGPDQGGDDPATPTTPDDASTVNPAVEEAKGPPFDLSEGTRPNQPWKAVTPADAKPLDAKRTEALLSRLPKLEDAETKAFARREGPPPPKLTGETVNETFPPRPGPPKVEPAPEGPLTVRRFQPEGEVAIAPHLSLTFSQPMVAVASVSELAAGAVPARLSPQPPGRWRWVGTRTLVFEPEGERFPMATEYKVSVAAGTPSASGGKLAAPVEWTFKTPPPKVLQGFPLGGPLALDPTFAVDFDQRVNPAAVLETITVDAGDGAIPLRLATEAEAAEVARGEPGRRVVFRAKDDLPGASRVMVTVGPNTPSAEGPRTSTAPHVYQFRTYGPLKVTSHHAGWGDRCPPGAPFRIEFSNPLDAEAFSADLVQVEPKVPGLHARVYGSQLQLAGMTKSNTTYTARLDPKIRDTFGQTLGDSDSLEFRTTSPNPALQGIGNNLLILDPSGKPQVHVRSVAVEELRVVVHKVDPAHWEAFGRWQGTLYDPKRRTKPPGKQVFNEEVDVKGAFDDWNETAIDLSAALDQGVGHAVVFVEPVDWPEKRWRPHVAVWVQSTKLGLDVQSDAGEILTWVTGLEHGKPVDGASVKFMPGGATARTNDAGLATLSQRPGRITTILASKGKDTVFLPGYWQRSESGMSFRWFTFDDRHLYRPKEEVRVKGWVRRYNNNEGGDVQPLKGVLPSQGYQVVDAHGQEIARGRIEFDDTGGFDLAVKLPDTIHVGMASVQFHGGHQHSFRVAEFRRPEFEVSVSPASGGPHFAGDDVVLTTKASYFAGGALPGAPVGWKVEAHNGSFTPPGRRDFAFGVYVPWWARMDDGEGFRGRGWGSPPPALHSQAFKGKTDAAGQHHMLLSLRALSRPITIKAEASVQDVNRQAWSGSTLLLVHPADVYVGLRMVKPYVPRGEPLAVDVLAVDLDGKAAVGRDVRLTFERVRWVWKQDHYAQETAKSETRTLTSKESAAREQLDEPEGGLWNVSATVTDAKGRVNHTTTQVWVAGGKGPSSKEVTEERVTLIPDAETYGHGDNAEVLVISPFSPAEGLMTLRRSGLIKTVRFQMQEATKVLEVPITDALVPGVTVHVALVGAAPREGEGGRTRPAFAAGKVTLKVPPTRRTLGLTVTPASKELTPGAKTSVDLVVTDYQGQPVKNAEVAVAVVDEAVLSLAGHTQPNPLAAFYGPRPDGVSDARARAFIRLQAPELPEEDEGAMKGVPEADGMMDEAPRAAMAPAPGGPMRQKGGRGGGGDQPAPPPIDLRKDMRALAVFSPSVRTDGRGAARIEYQLPDSLTRYRIVAVAADGGNAFGSQEATLKARLPLMVRPSPPRFLNFGDTCELPLVIQNQTDAPLEVEVALRAANLAITQGQGRLLTIPGRDRREVRFPVAADQAGRARVQIAAASGEFVDAQEIVFPVWTPATTEAFATYGTLTGKTAAMAQPVSPPKDAWPEYGGLEITTSSTGLQALTDAVIYLVEYPYGCAEQISSRVMALVAVRDVLQAFQAEGLPSAAALEAGVARDLGRLSQLQNPADGGWGWWRSGDPSWPYLTIHVTHALYRAKQKGYDVDSQGLARAHQYLKRVETRIPSWYSKESRWALVAYALYVREKLGDRDVQRAHSLFAQAGTKGLSFEALGWIYPLLRNAQDPRARADAKTIRGFFSNRVVETAGAAHFVTSYSDGAHVLLHSERRVDGIVLEALLDDPAELEGDLVPKLVQGLLAHRKRGCWYNTQENAFILLAFDRYFRTAEKVTPDFVARAWLGDAFAGEHAFRGRTTERSHIGVPMAWLQSAKDANLTLAKDGPGRLYYRIGLRYAPKDLKLPPLEAGFTVERRYEPVDDPKDVRKDTDGTWHVRAGARVRVRVTMLAPSRRYHVALVDPLPAGFEPLDPALAATGSLPADPGGSTRGRDRWWWWYRTWYEHSGLRDERAEAFTSLLWEGVHNYSYMARATTPGSFVAPPAKAEEMYAPETFGRSGTDKVIVE